jgi:adenylate cyclase
MQNRIVKLATRRPLPLGSLDRSASVSSDDAEAAMERVLRSRQFSSTHRIRRFLEYIVRKVQQDKSEEIREYNVGIEVFDRSPANYDPSTDPIVRVQARRLREKLKEYYQSEGMGDPLLIEVSVGSYVPKFRWRRVEETVEPEFEPGSNLMAILPFLSISREPEMEQFCEELTEEVNFALRDLQGWRVVSRTSIVRILPRISDIRRMSQRLGVDRCIEGSVRKSGACVRVNARLIQAIDGAQLWCGQYDKEMSDSLTTQTSISRLIRRGIRHVLSR